MPESLPGARWGTPRRRTVEPNIKGHQSRGVPTAALDPHAELERLLDRRDARRPDYSNREV